MAKPSTYNTAIDLFTADLVENLFADNAFLTRSLDWSSMAVGKTVVWNEEGAPTEAKINSTTGHGAAVSRTDVRKSFDIDEIITRPTKLDWTNEMVINYNKRMSILRNHSGSSGEAIAMRTLFNWSPNIAANIVRTSGVTKTAAAPGATGTRKKITYEDLLAARRILNKQNIPLTGRQLLVPADMEEDMMAIQGFISIDTVNNKPVETGMIGTILGMDVFVRSATIIYDNAATPQPIKALDDDTYTPYAGAATDNQSALMWHSSYTVRAISSSSLASVIPVHGGDELSTTTIAGGSSMATSFKGIVAIVEQP